MKLFAFTILKKEVTSAIIQFAKEQGVPKKYSEQLATAMETLADKISGLGDFGIFFPTEEVCSKFGVKHSLAPESVDEAQNFF